jgi:hypothetical protein
MNAEQALEMLEWCDRQLRGGKDGFSADSYSIQKLREARAFFADLLRREEWQRNALEHIANTCPGRAAEVARVGLSAPQGPQT